MRPASVLWSPQPRNFTGDGLRAEVFTTDALNGVSRALR